MNLLDILPIAYSSLKDRKLRTVLTMLGILIGPATIVSLLSITGGFNAGITQQFEKMGVNTVVVMPARAGRTLTTTDVTKLQGIGNVRTVSPFYQSVAALSGGTSVSISAIAPQDTARLIPGFSLSEGRLPDDYEITGAVIGYNLAYPSDPAKSPLRLDQVVTVTRTIREFGRTKTVTRSFLVVGIANKFGQGLMLNVDDGILVSLKAGQVLTGSTSYSGIFVIADRVENVNGIVDSISSVLENVRTITVQQILDTVQTILGTVTLLLLSIALMSVVVAFFGIMTTMLTTVTERTREIGLLKALGYNNRVVMLIFLAEASLMGLIGGALGSSLGAGLSFVLIHFLSQSLGSNPGGSQRAPVGGAGGAPMGGQFGGSTSFFNISPLISPELVGGAVLMAAAVATLAGLIPAWRASKLTPVEALRHE